MVGKHEYMNMGPRIYRVCYATGIMTFRESLQKISNGRVHQQNSNQLQDESEEELFAVDSNKNKNNRNAKKFFANLALLNGNKTRHISSD